MSNVEDLENQIRLLKNENVDLAVRVSIIEDALSALSTVISSPKVVDVNQLSIYEFNQEQEMDGVKSHLSKFPFNSEKGLT